VEETRKSLQVQGFAVFTEGKYHTKFLLQHHRKLIKTFLYYNNNPITINRIYTHDRSFKHKIIKRTLVQLIYEGVVEEPEKGKYNLNMSKLKEVIKVVPEEQFEDYYDKALLYLHVIKYSELFYEQALLNNITDPIDIQEYIIEETIKKFERSKELSRKHKERKKRDGKTLKERKIYLHKLRTEEGQEYLEKLIKGEINIEEYRKLGL